MDVLSIIGQQIGDYRITEYVGGGCNGFVFKAEYPRLSETRAIKFIPIQKIKKNPDWEQEIIKVNRLSGNGGVVRYHNHNEIVLNSEKYLYVEWEFVSGTSLKSLIEHRELTIQTLYEVVRQSLSVFYSCQKLNMQHADFHAGNIIIQDPDPLDIDGNTQRVRITDFGYGTFSITAQTPPMDDYDGLAKIIKEGLDSINYHNLLSRSERRIFQVLKYEFPKYIHETNPLEGDYVRQPKEMRDQLHRLINYLPENEYLRKNIGDFLAAEFIGNQYDEWKALFVPKFLAIDDLLDRNICVLTGLRGCGKTTIFKRLSYDLQSRLGYAGIKGEDGFIGFYFNARSLAEAFPWLPKNRAEVARKQIINFFNAKWCIEVLRWLRSCLFNQPPCTMWLYDFFKVYLPDILYTGSDNSGIINCIIEGCQSELLRAKLDSAYSADKYWPFCSYDFLNNLIDEINKHHSLAEKKSIFFFLDDYSLPMVNETMQQILNPIIFRRAGNVFFKVSTESSESIMKTGLQGKVLEDGADYKLIDLGSVLFRADDTGLMQDIIISIFEKRISRTTIFSGTKLSLQTILGNANYSNNELAAAIRSNGDNVLYYGIETFCSLWSSDIRELIKALSDMITSVGEEYLLNAKKNNFCNIPLIPATVQHNVLKQAGGRFLQLLTVATNPQVKNPIIRETSYGDHLIEIVSAFIEIAAHDLKYKNTKNQDTHPAKQARRIELKVVGGDWKGEAEAYYRGLIRYGIFIKDVRAKSVNSSPAQRLYLRGLLIPHAKLTFSKRDSIMMDWDSFNEFLINPHEFAKQYISSSSQLEGQIELEFGKSSREE